MTMELPRFAGAVDDAKLIEALRETGAAVVERVLDDDVIDRCAVEMRPEFDACGRLTENDFNGYTTLRISSVLGYAPSTQHIIAHPLALAMADAFLLPHCLDYRIGSNTGIEILPGETDQVLHTDDSIYPVRIPGMQLQLNAMWSLCDFTQENGATRVVLGSHKPFDYDAGDQQPEPGTSRDAPGFGAVLSGQCAARRRRELLQCAAHGADQHLFPGLVAPGGQPVPRRAAREGKSSTTIGSAVFWVTPKHGSSLGHCRIADEVWVRSEHDHTS